MAASIAELAEMMAAEAHAGQVDKAGQPYITHPARVAARVAGDEHAVAAAWLHDVVEDTEITLADLEQAFPPDVTAAVDALTRRRDETPAEYYARVRTVPLALTVKLADMADNSDPQRLALLDVATRERLIAKYARARAELTAGV
ncbi:HD domain-containing protein [Rhodococcus sp. SMB37]|uniref:HD domain-containing protein n=1 Tax=Rhodococcus sp. SMB37 TaxID=2512213 RepID=UPI00104DF1A4|nr:HD domain-containing protein [Rhodococcus sp. SMB37]TCN53453.1 HD domain-containing protein [Rhodococcus sp. SMB37]